MNAWAEWRGVGGGWEVGESIRCEAATSLGGPRVELDPASRTEPVLASELSLK